MTKPQAVVSYNVSHSHLYPYHDRDIGMSGSHDRDIGVSGSHCMKRLPDRDIGMSGSHCMKRLPVDKALVKN